MARYLICCRLHLARHIGKTNVGKRLSPLAAVAVRHLAVLLAAIALRLQLRPQVVCPPPQRRRRRLQTRRLLLRML